MYEANGTATTRAVAAYFREGRDNLRPLDSMSIEQQGPPTWIINATVTHLYPTIYPINNHGLEKGDTVRLRDAGQFGNRSAALNGWFKIIEIEGGPNFSWFKFETTGNPGSLSGDFSPGYYGRMWGLELCMVESNIIELNLRTMGPAGYNDAAGIFMYGGGAQPQYRMRQFIGRDNLIRNIENRSDPNKDTVPYNGLAYAIWFTPDLLAENALLQKNCIRLDQKETGADFGSITYFGSQLKTFDNNSPDGSLILARDRSNAALFTAPELTAAIRLAIEDSLIASIVL